jgi:hypothetical protein
VAQVALRLGLLVAAVVVARPFLDRAEPADLDRMAAVERRQRHHQQPRMGPVAAAVAEMVRLHRLHLELMVQQGFKGTAWYSGSNDRRNDGLHQFDCCATDSRPRVLARNLVGRLGSSARAVQQTHQGSDRYRNGVVPVEHPVRLRATSDPATQLAMIEFGNLIIGIFSTVLIILSGVNAWLMFVLKEQSTRLERFRSDVTNLQAIDLKLSEELAVLRVLVAGSYLTRVEFADTMRVQTDAILRAVEKVDHRVESKADKPTRK